jgi:predicted nucleic acid-binding protein
LLIVDASALVEVAAVLPGAAAVRTALEDDTDQGAPALVDAEVLAVVRRYERSGQLDRTSAILAVTGLKTWPGERWPHGPLIDRVWELRHNVRSYDAFYVALAESLGATLLTLDARLVKAPGIRCDVLVPS